MVCSGNVLSGILNFYSLPYQPIKLAFLLFKVFNFASECNIFYFID